MSPKQIRIEEDEKDGGLLTPMSLAQSLAAPRFPPVGSLHYQYYQGKQHHLPSDVSASPLHAFYQKPSPLFQRKISFKEQQSKLKKWKQREQNATKHRTKLSQSTLKNLSKSPSSSPHPHLPKHLNSEDCYTRWLGSWLTIPTQHHIRDSGQFRSISDGLITYSTPLLALRNPRIAYQFLELTQKVQRISYGDHPMQEIHLLEPNYKICGNDRGLIFFVHGGAWGSGRPWMYRLVASPFLEAGLAIAIVGYRTYPDANAQEQVNDLEKAAAVLEQTRSDLYHPSTTDRKHWKGYILCGHSSGAHIALLMLVDRVSKELNKERMNIPFQTFIGISGPYNVSHHFDYEAGRGVEELSPLKPANGYTRMQLEYHSPAIRLQKLLSQKDAEKIISSILPRMLLVHGIEDTVVPFTNTSECASLLRMCGVSQCEELYLGKTGHEDTIMQFMLGGKTRKAVLEWLSHVTESKKNVTASVNTMSKL